MKKLSFSLLIIVVFAFHSSAQNLKKAINSLDCKQVKTSDVTPVSISQNEYENWQKETLHIKSVESLTAKCRAKDGRFYTILFEEETFATEAEAAARLSNIRQAPPNEVDKSILYDAIRHRQGFQNKTRIYTIGNTANYVLGDSIAIWINKIQKKIKSLER